MGLDVGEEQYLIANRAACDQLAGRNLERAGLIRRRSRPGGLVALIGPAELARIAARPERYQETLRRDDDAIATRWRIRDRLGFGRRREIELPLIDFPVVMRAADKILAEDV